MAESTFPFLRATYYLWLARLPKHASAGLTDAPASSPSATCTSRTSAAGATREGRLAWGVNDLDEVATLPYTYDLLRLSASALLAVRERRLPLAEHEVTELVLEGYRAGLASGGKPFVAGEHHRWLARTARRRHDFWPRLEQLPAPEGPPCRPMRRPPGLALAPHGRVAADAPSADGRARQPRPSPGGRGRPDAPAARPRAS